MDSSGGNGGFLANRYLFKIGYALLNKNRTTVV